MHEWTDWLCITAINFFLIVSGEQPIHLSPGCSQAHIFFFCCFFCFVFVFFYFKKCAHSLPVSALPDLLHTHSHIHEGADTPPSWTPRHWQDPSCRGHRLWSWQGTEGGKLCWTAEQVGGREFKEHWYHLPRSTAPGCYPGFWWSRGPIWTEDHHKVSHPPVQFNPMLYDWRKILFIDCYIVDWSRSTFSVSILCNSSCMQFWPLTSNWLSHNFYRLINLQPTSKAVSTLPFLQPFTLTSLKPPSGCLFSP